MQSTRFLLVTAIALAGAVALEATSLAQRAVDPSSAGDSAGRDGAGTADNSAPNIRDDANASPNADRADDNTFRPDRSDNDRADDSDEGDDQVEPDRRTGASAAGRQNTQADFGRRNARPTDDDRTFDRDSNRPGRTNRQSDEQRDEQRDDSNRDEGEDDLGISFTQSENRLQIGRLRQDSYFGRAGIRERDIVLSINGRNIGTRDDFYRWVRRANTNAPLAIGIIRGGQRRTIYLDPSDRPGFDAEGYAYDDSDHGALGVLLDSQYANAAIVVEVYPESPAEHSGLRPGDHILAINGQEVRSPQDVTRVVSEMEPGATVEVDYSRRLRRRTEVRLGSRDILSENERPRGIPATVRGQNADFDAPESVSSER